jgi:hypothetical protein
MADILEHYLMAREGEGADSGKKLARKRTV